MDKFKVYVSSKYPRDVYIEVSPKSKRMVPLSGSIFLDNLPNCYRLSRNEGFSEEVFSSQQMAELQFICYLTPEGLER